jgi:hypothetical protein
MMDGVIEAFAEFLNGVKRGIDFAPLNKAYLTEVQPGFISQFFLGQSLLQAAVTAL